MSTKRKLPYREGTWFAVPLRKGGYSVGRVARMAPKGKILLAYFFGPKRETIPSLSEVSQLQPENAIKLKRFGDLGLTSKEWPVIGDSENWEQERHLWPIPVFYRRDPITKSTWRVIYPDLDPSEPEREERVPYDTPGEPDSFAGYVAAEITLTKILDP